MKEYVERAYLHNEEDRRGPNKETEEHEVYITHEGKRFKVKTKMQAAEVKSLADLNRYKNELLRRWWVAAKTKEGLYEASKPSK